MKETRLIVNADDLGMSRGITDGILMAHKHGFLTSASLMPNMPAAEYAVARLCTAPKLAVGVHLNICQGRPLLHPCETRSLVGPDGRFHPAPVMARRLWRWQVSAAELEGEFREQIRWMKHRGLQPTHADSHQHMHIYPAAARPFARALAAEGIGRARAPRCSYWPRTGSLGRAHAGGALRRLLVYSYRSALQTLVFRDLASPDSRVAFLPRHRGDLRTLGARWRITLQNLPPGTFEFACHPGLPDADFRGTDAIRAQREEELRWLMDHELRSIIAECGIRLITYNDIPAPGAIARVAAAAAAM
jgi:predicted glycoside hydrolase/deacetylase ChbG (UPF0249 family)